jgi:hypothetical protein
LDFHEAPAWAVLKANHKASGLAAGTINRMLSSPELPPHVRVTILTYVEEKLAGLYGHNKEQLIDLQRGFDPCNRGHSPGKSRRTGFIEQRKKSPAASESSGHRPMSKAGELNMPPHDAVAHLMQFARRSKVRWGFLLLVAFAGNVLVATLAWTIVRLVH